MLLWQFPQPLVTLIRVSYRWFKIHHPPTNPIGIPSVLHRPSPSREIGTVVRRPPQLLRNEIPSQSHSYTHTQPKPTQQNSTRFKRLRLRCLHSDLHTQNYGQNIVLQPPRELKKKQNLCLTFFRLKMPLVPTWLEQQPPNGGVPLLEQIRTKEPKPSRTSPQLSYMTGSQIGSQLIFTIY